MMLCNDVSRYHVAATAVRLGGLHNARVQPTAHELATLFMHMAQKTLNTFIGMTKVRIS